MDEYRYSSRNVAGTTEIDQGLKSHMQSIYNRMALGVFITGATAWTAANTGLTLAILQIPLLMMVIAFAPLGIVLFGFRPQSMPSNKLALSFIAISVLYGLSFSVIFLAVAGVDIARTFFVTTAAFAGLSLFGYTTKKSLSGLGSFLIMGVWGLLAVSVASIFFPSEGLADLVAGAGILIFGGLVAYETQKMKDFYRESHGSEQNSRIAWMGALNLYISFIALFQYILHFMQGRD